MPVQQAVPLQRAPVPTPRRTQASRRTEAETALLDAAARLFAQHGVEQTSLADIGEAAGYSRGLVNHHFGTRAGLVERLARRGERRFVRAIDGIEQVAGAEAIAALAGAYLGLFTDPTDDLRAFMVMRGTALPSDAPLREVYAAGDRRFRDGIEQLVRSGQADGSVATHLDPASFAVMLVGMLRGVGTQFLIDPDGIDFAATRRHALDFVRAALAPSPA